jgi:mannose-1-phosphate guanylyltransferase
MNKNNYCVIMAGGIGSRFWPLSKTLKPKQFLDILGVGRTFLQMTYDRFLKVCPSENIFVVTNEIYSTLVAEQLPDLKSEQILAEPLRRNTAPCIAYANMKIRQLNHEANIVVAPSDHLILEEEKFLGILKIAMEFTSENNGLLTLGITPNRPETGYGYIQTTHKSDFKKFPAVEKVKTFTEKPDYEIAVQFVKSGEFFWNSGIFIWSLKSISLAFEQHQQDIASLFMPGMEISSHKAEKEFVKAAYAECKNISVDKGIMENADNVYVLCGDFGWSDLGTWDSLYENSEKNKNGDVLFGKNIMTYETKNILVNVPNDKLVVLQGLEDYIVAESENMLLVCKRNDERKIRDIVSDIKVKKGENFV